jgi:hypothetical protein
MHPFSVLGMLIALILHFLGHIDLGELQRAYVEGVDLAIGEREFLSHIQAHSPLLLEMRPLGAHLYVLSGIVATP